jgi:hypothetical protein
MLLNSRYIYSIPFTYLLLTNNIYSTVIFKIRNNNYVTYKKNVFIYLIIITIIYWNFYYKVFKKLNF